MEAPQIVMICFYVFALAVDLVKHGEPQDDHNFFITLVGSSIGVGVLYWGGFWG